MKTLLACVITALFASTPFFAIHSSPLSEEGLEQLDQLVKEEIHKEVDDLGRRQIYSLTGLEHLVFDTLSRVADRLGLDGIVTLGEEISAPSSDLGRGSEERKFLYILEAAIEYWDRLKSLLKGELDSNLVSPEEYVVTLLTVGNLFTTKGLKQAEAKLQEFLPEDLDSIIGEETKSFFSDLFRSHYKNGPHYRILHKILEKIGLLTLLEKSGLRFTPMSDSWKFSAAEARVRSRANFYDALQLDGLTAVNTLKAIKNGEKTVLRGTEEARREAKFLGSVMKGTKGKALSVYLRTNSLQEAKQFKGGFV